jgi:V/A-type H+/Na+-transporting ATPase subunit E
MGLDEVKEDIIKDAKAEVEKIVKKAQEQIKEKTLESSAEIDKISKEEIKKIKEDLELFEKRELAVINLEAKKTIFSKKKEIINSIVENAKQEIITMNEKEKKSLLKKLVDKANKEIEADTILCNKKEVKIINSITKINTQETDINGGIIVENADKSMRIDLSYDALFEEIYENKLQELAETLF